MSVAASPRHGGPVRVMVVDDSAVVRQVLTALLGADPGIEVVATASDPVFARRTMAASWPDVLVLDVEMPRMDGISFLRQLMAERPTPVVICSSLTTRGAETTMAAMAAGAVAVFAKPTTGLRGHLEEHAAELVGAVKAAAAADPRRLRALPAAPVAPLGRTGPAPAGASHPAPPTARLGRTTDRIVAVGTSTGGTQALEVVLRALPRLDAGMVVVQHMPERFTAAFAARLDACCAADVAEAADGDRVLAGRVLIAPGGRHMRVVRDGAQYRVKVTDGPRVNRHKPSVDVLFRSVAATAGANALGVILTGMGDDGAAGLLEMRRAGAATVGQDEATCVVYGMPAAAKAAGAVVDEVPLQAVPRLIHRFTDEDR